MMIKKTNFCTDNHVMVIFTDNHVMVICTDNHVMVICTDNHVMVICVQTNITATVMTVNRSTSHLQQIQKQCVQIINKIHVTNVQQICNINKVIEFKNIYKGSGGQKQLNYYKLPLWKKVYTVLLLSVFHYVSVFFHEISFTTLHQRFMKFYQVSCEHA